MRYGLLYVAGHATMVAILGTAAIAFRMALPPASDRLAERLVGITLLLLGIYVLLTFFRPGMHNHGPRTRITLLINGVLWLYWRLSKIFGGTRAEAPQVFKDGCGSTSAFVVGVIHGVGAETFTQVSLFLAAASLGGVAGLGPAGVHSWVAGDEYNHVRRGRWVVLRDLHPSECHAALSRSRRRAIASWRGLSSCGGRRGGCLR